MPAFSNCSTRWGLSSHWWALLVTWVPKGLVSTSTSPGSAPSGAMISASWQQLEATPPIMGHGLSTVWPPVMRVPASAARSLNPLMRRGTTTSLWLSVSLVLTAITMSMLSQRVTPRA
uniref:Secreted protein n=1 Tax=Ixodes ricinus TaxID=34613 RepID=A0A6B0ULT0_IXORI